MAEDPIHFAGGAPITADLDVRWIHGSPSPRRNTDPKIQVHACDPHTFILRETVDQILAGWLDEHPRERYELVVAHTHAHSDHIAGDPQFQDRPATTVAATDTGSVRSFFRIDPWPDQLVGFDLGGRVLEVTGCPGHHATSIAVYDPWTGFLVTGDTVYPGRLYVRDFPAFTASLDRLVATARSRPVTWVMGCHIEMTSTPGRAPAQGRHRAAFHFVPHQIWQNLFFLSVACRPPESYRYA